MRQTDGSAVLAPTSRGVCRRARVCSQNSGVEGGRERRIKKTKKRITTQKRFELSRAEHISLALFLVFKLVGNASRYYVLRLFNHSATASITDANIDGRKGGMENLSVLFSTKEKPVFQYLTPGAGSPSDQKHKKRCPRIRTGPDDTALKTRLQTEHFSAKKRRQATAPQKTAALRSIRHATSTTTRSGRAP